MSQRIAFIGLGNMGLPMLLNLKKAGYEVRGFDLAAAAVEAALAAGVEIPTTAAEALEGVDVVITMLPAGRHVLSVWKEALPLLDSDTLLIDCSTIDVDSARAAHEMAASAGMLSLDAPVSGGVGGASAGTLTFMTGGSEEAFEAASPILSRMGARIVYCGAAGAGQAAKICNNMILGISMIAVSEAFVLAEKLGLSNQALFDVSSTASGQCWSLTSYCPVPGPVPNAPSNNGYRPGFAADLMLKDLTLAQDAAALAGAETPLGRHAREIYAAFAEAGQGGSDFSGIVNHLRARSGEREAS